MSQFPHLPLFTDAYIADTAHLTCEQHGAYLRLLMFAWRSNTCSVPAEDAKLARMLGLSVKAWNRIKVDVLAFWTLKDGTYVQSRLLREKKFVTGQHERKRAAGKLGGKAKALKSKETDLAVLDGCQKQEGGYDLAPIPIPIEASASSAGTASVGLELRKAIARAFAEIAPKRLCPDTGRAEVWLAQGHRPEIILAVVRERLARKPDVGSLSYFDRSIEEASKTAKGAGGYPGQPPADTPATPKQIRNAQFSMAVAHYLGEWRQGWPSERRPEHPDCTTPAEILAEAKAQAARERGDEQEAA